MKRLLIIAAACAALVGTAHARHGHDARVSVDFFYSSLASYGEWIQIDAGSYVWRPMHVRRGWRPYLYGRWYYDDYYGWVWVPDYQWGPAWVEWRYSDDYIGWAPLPPHATFSISIGIHFTRAWVAPMRYWTFVGCRNFTRPHIAQHVVPFERSHRFFESTRSVTRYDTEGDRIINRGVDVGFVERQGKVKIDRLEVVETRDRMADQVLDDRGRQRVEVYRPQRKEIEQSESPSIEPRRSIERSDVDRQLREQKIERQRPERSFETDRPRIDERRPEMKQSEPRHERRATERRVTERDQNRRSSEGHEFGMRDRGFPERSRRGER